MLQVDKLLSEALDIFPILINPLNIFFLFVSRVPTGYTKDLHRQPSKFLATHQPLPSRVTRQLESIPLQVPSW